MQTSSFHPHNLKKKVTPIYFFTDPPLPTQDQWKLQETSSYGKSSCVLPITFFDIQSNIQLLNECNPLSIQVVDCDKHPWYYKKYMRPHASEKSGVDMENSKEPSNKKSVQLVGEDAVQCIDLTENTCDVHTNVNKTAVNLNKVVTNDNKMPPINTAKKKKPHVPKLTTKNYSEKHIACSQVDLSKIDLKHNTGLVGLRITKTLDFNTIPVRAKVKKPKKTVPIVTEQKNDKVDECFSAASKALNILGTIIVPVNAQGQIQNVGEEISDNNHERKVPSQSSAQITVSKPKDVVKPGPKSVKKQRLKNKSALLPVSIKSVVNDKLKSNTQGKLSSQPLDEKTDERIEIAKVTAIPESFKEILKLAKLSCKRVSNTKKIKHQTNETGTEDTSRSKSPIFPCNSKHKIQSEPETHLKLNENDHAELKHDQENTILVKDSAKSVSKCHQESSITETLHDNVNKNADGNLNETRCEQTSLIKNNTLKNGKHSIHTKKVSVQGNEHILHIDPEKRVISIIDATKPTDTSTKYKPKSSYKCKKTPVANFNTNQVIRLDGVNKNAKTASATNSMISQMQRQNNSSSKSSIQNKPDLIVDERHEKLVAILQKHFSNINKNTHAPKVSGKPEMISKAPPPNTVLPLPVEAGKTKMNLPIQTQASNIPEIDRGCPRSVFSAFSSQNMNVRLPKQPVRIRPAYCKVNGISNNFVRYPNILHMNPSHLDPMHTNVRWNPRLHFPIPPFMHPPPLFLPPPPLPSSIENFKNIIHSLKNSTSTPSEEATNNAASNLKDVFTPAKPKSANNNTIPDKSINNGNSSLPLPPFASPRDRPPAEKTKSNEQKNPCRVPNLSPAPTTPDMPPVHQKKPKFFDDKRHHLSEKNVTRHDNVIQKNNNIGKLHDVTIIPVGKPSVLNCTPNTNTKISKTTNEYVNRDDKTSEEEKKNDGSSLHSGKNDSSQMDKSNKKPKPGPLCMKNRTGPFAEKPPTQTTNSHPNKGYSPPILPIPTFQTVLSQTHDLQASMRHKEPRNENPHTSQFSYPPAQNRTSNSCVADKSSRKRLHYEEKGINEVKKVKKIISYADYKNRSSNSDKNVGLPIDPSSTLGRKYARKSENSCKSVKSLADVVNQGMNYGKDACDRNSVQVPEI